MAKRKLYRQAGRLFIFTSFSFYFQHSIPKEVLHKKKNRLKIILKLTTKAKFYWHSKNVTNSSSNIIKSKFRRIFDIFQKKGEKNLNKSYPKHTQKSTLQLICRRDQGKIVGYKRPKII